MKSETDFSNLSRPIHEMPDFVQQALDEHDLMERYKACPAYHKMITSAGLIVPDEQKRKRNASIRC